MRDIVRNRKRVSRMAYERHERQDQLKAGIVRWASVESEIFRLKCGLVGNFDRFAIELNRATNCAA